MAPAAACDTREIQSPALTEYWNPEWRSDMAPSQGAFSCRVCIFPEEDGSFSAVVLNLPGAGSCGDTEEDALCNAKEAIRGVIESHRASDEDIPWCDVVASDIPANAKLKWIVVNV